MSADDHDEILIALRRITRAIDLRSKDLLKKTGLTAPQLAVLQALRRQGALSGRAVAQAVSLSQPTVTSILDRLERDGLVVRQRSEADRRVVHVRLTEQGRERVGAAPELLQAGFLREYRRLDEWERHMLIAALQRIAAMMDAQDLDASPILGPADLLE